MRLAKTGKQVEGNDMAKKKHSKVRKVMGEFKRGTLRSGSKHGPKVKSRKQAIAIALSEQRRASGKDDGYAKWYAATKKRH